MDNNELGTNLAEVGADCSEFPNNSDVISRQAAIDALGELATFTEDWSCHTWMYTDDVYNAIKQLPPIQPEIIRCKDCKWWDRYNDNNGYCMAAKSCTYTSHWDIQIRRTYDGDFYCAHAEPKEEYEEDEDE